MSSYSWKVQLIGLIGWGAVVSLAAMAGAVASVHASQFYSQLTRPPWAPPSWVFGPVWTVLYVLMAIAAWLIWRDSEVPQARVGIALFLFQLSLNALWSWFFFRWHWGGWAFLDIVLLWAFIIGTIAVFWRIKPLAGCLLLPYFLWVSFAAVLNYAVWQQNRALLG